jgi:hypothetical protein
MPDLRRGIWVLSFCALAVGAGTISGPSTAAPTRVATTSNACTIRQTKSLQGTVRTDIRFVNKSAGAVKIYWLDYSGKRVFYKTLAAGAAYVQQTWVTHPWVAINAAGACIGYVIAPKAEYVITDGGGGGGPPPMKKPTFTAVVCTIVVNGPSSTCTAQVADAGIGRSTPPSGNVTFSAASGIVGSSCTLAGTPGSPGIASCTVSYTPSSTLVQGEPPPVTARYSGDSLFEASSGGSSYYPASVLGPSIINATPSGGIPTDLVNHNPFPVNVDEELTVTGISLASARVTQGAAGITLIGKGSFSLKPLAAKLATIKLNAKGRALLAKHKSLHAVLTVTTRAKGKPTRKTTRRLLLKVR